MWQLCGDGDMRQVQCFDWNNAQATFHPPVACLQNEMIECVSFVVISRCLEQGTVGVCLSQSKLCSFHFGNLKDLT